MNDTNISALIEEERRRKYNTTATYQEVTDNFIQEIMDEFDFDKVHRVMEFLDWGWFNVDSGTRVPSKGEIRKFARNLLQQVIKDRRSCATGGFVVTIRHGTEDEIPWVSMGLSFRIETCDFDGEFYIQAN